MSNVTGLGVQATSAKCHDLGVTDVTILNMTSVMAGLHLKLCLK